MKEIICIVLYIILAVLLFIRIRMLDRMEQRERQMRVTRRRWLFRRLFYILVSGVICGSLTTGAAGVLLGMHRSDMEISKIYFWISAVLVIMVMVTFYYLMTLSGKLLLIYFGTLVLWVSLSAFLPFVFSLPQFIRQPIVWCVIIFFIWLVMFVFYRRLFLKKDLCED